MAAPEYAGVAPYKGFCHSGKRVPPGTLGGYAHSCARGAVAPLPAERSEAMVSQRVLKLVSKRPPCAKGLLLSMQFLFK